jgi:hypothetical protein
MRSKALVPLVAFQILLLAQVAVCHATTCQAMPAESWIPQKKLYTSAAPTAATSEPLTIDFSGDSLAYVSIGSNPDHPGKRYRIRALIKTSNSPSEFVENCDSGWQVLSVSGVDYELKGIPETIGWRIQIFDSRDPKEVIADPLNVNLALGSIKYISDSPANKNPLAQSPALKCVTTWWSDIPPEPNPLAPQFPVPAIPPSPPPALPVALDENQEMFRGSTTIRYIRGQPSLNVRADISDDKLWGRVKLRIAVKADSTDTFASSCEQSLPNSPHMLHTLIAASANVQSNVPTIWRIETVVDPPLPQDYPNPHVHLNVQSAIPPTQSAGLTFSEFICEQSVTRRIAGRGAESSNQFASSTKLVVDLDDAANALTPTSRHEVVNSILSAIELWRVTCRACTADNLSVAEVDKQLYVLSPVVNAFNQPHPEATGPFSGRPYDGLFFYLNYRTGSRGVIEPHFLPVSRQDAPVVALCATDPSTLPPELKRIQIALRCSDHNPAPVVSESTALLLQILPGFTACGPDTNVIACENNRSVVALNSRDYSFVDAQTKPIFGSGGPKVSLMHVLLHEVGHWIGLEHIDSWGNIMYESLSQSRCIDDVDANALLVVAAGVPPGPKPPASLFNGPAIIGKGEPPAPFPTLPPSPNDANKPANFLPRGNPRPK